MTQYKVYGSEKALIFFADIIDSSQYSSILGIEEYAYQVIDFQKIFTSLAKIYFPESPNNFHMYRNIYAKGDEGIIFYFNHEWPQYELIYNAIKFAFELKGRIEFKAHFNADSDSSPKKMKVAIGIHYGPVAVISKNDDQTNCEIINRIEGYSINYTKRIESASRIGQFSKIFLSSEAASLIASDPIILKQHISDLKGIVNTEFVYEIRSAAFLDGFPKDIKDLNIQKFIEKEAKGEYQLDLVREPWLKGYILSVLHNISSDENTEKDYMKRISKLIWDNINEDDPLLLLMRVHECNREKKYSRSIEYLKQIINDFPHFFHAKVEFVKTVINFASTVDRIEQSDLIYARDIAQEIIDKYPSIISPDENIIFNEFISKNRDIKNS